MAETHNGENDSLFSDMQYQISMKRFFSLVFSLLCVCSFLFASEWVWDTKGFDLQRKRIGEEVWREIPSYYESYVFHDNSSDTAIYVPWVDRDDGWSHDETADIEAQEEVPIISASEYIEIRKQEDIKEQKEIRKFVGFGRFS